MKPSRFGAILALWVCALALAVGCSSRSSGGQSEPSRPTAATEPDIDGVRSQLLENNFAILYSLQIGNVEGELLWRKVGALNRWDFFYRLEDGTHGIDVTINEDGDDIQGCNWELDGARLTERQCRLGGNFGYEEFLFFPLFFFDLKFDGVQERLGEQVDCYSAAPDERGDASACFNAQGYPLEVDARYRQPARIEAIQYWPSSDLEKVRVIPTDAPEGAAVTAVDLPPIPALAAYLETQEAE